MASGTEEGTKLPAEDLGGGVGGGGQPLWTYLRPRNAGLLRAGSEAAAGRRPRRLLYIAPTNQTVENVYKTPDY